MEVLVFVEGFILPTPEEVPPTIPINETISPLPRPRRDLPVGGRLAHFQKYWEDITEDPWVLSVIRKGNKILFIGKPFLSPTPVLLPFPNSCFSQADQRSSTGRRGHRTPTQRGSGENRPRRSRILISNFLGSQENR